jgi:hypothetical protein
LLAARGHTRNENRNIRDAANAAGLNALGRRQLGREVEAQKQAMDRLGGNARLSYDEIETIAEELAQNERFQRRTS